MQVYLCNFYPLELSLGVDSSQPLPTKHLYNDSEKIFSSSHFLLYCLSTLDFATPLLASKSIRSVLVDGGIDDEALLRSNKIFLRKGALLDKFGGSLYLSLLLDRFRNDGDGGPQTSKSESRRLLEDIRLSLEYEIVTIIFARYKRESPLFILYLEDEKSSGRTFNRAFKHVVWNDFSHHHPMKKSKKMEKKEKATNESGRDLADSEEKMQEVRVST